MGGPTYSCTKASINCLSGVALQGATILTMLLLFLYLKFNEDVIGLAAAVIKKWKYWPKHVPGDAMDKKMELKEVGEYNHNLAPRRELLMTCLL
jgi:hypothetical protein